MSLSDIPVEVLIDNVFPFCAVPDILSLGCTNRFFALLTSDDTFWRRKLDDDFNFNGADTARTSGFKFIYRRLSNPRVFVWG
jgi:SCF-associated factor 1